MAHLTLQLNAKLRPFDRHDLYEDVLDELMEVAGNIGHTDGGGTSVGEDDEVAYCDVKVVLHDDTSETLEKFYTIIDTVGVPKGSFLINGDDKMPIGSLEGLALYMNGTELPDEYYEKYDINFAIGEICKLLEGKGDFYSYNENLKDTALYFFGESFEEMIEAITPFINEYPLCEKSRIVQIA